MPDLAEIVENDPLLFGLLAGVVDLNFGERDDVMTVLLNSYNLLVKRGFFKTKEDFLTFTFYLCESYSAFLISKASSL